MSLLIIVNGQNIQANLAGMMSKGYSWIVTDGVTGAHHLIEQENRLFPDYLDGLIGTMPKSTAGPAFQKFAKLYSQNFTRERLLTTGFLQWNPSSLTVGYIFSLRGFFHRASRSSCIHSGFKLICCRISDLHSSGVRCRVRPGSCATRASVPRVRAVREEAKLSDRAGAGQRVGTEKLLGKWGHTRQGNQTCENFLTFTILLDLFVYVGDL